VWNQNAIAYISNKNAAYGAVHSVYSTWNQKDLMGMYLEDAPGR
jgi:hypothetical protein